MRFGQTRVARAARIGGGGGAAGGRRRVTSGEGQTGTRNDACDTNRRFCSRTRPAGRTAASAPRVGPGETKRTRERPGRRPNRRRRRRRVNDEKKNSRRTTRRRVDEASRRDRSHLPTNVDRIPSIERERARACLRMSTRMPTYVSSRTLSPCAFIRGRRSRRRRRPPTSCPSAIRAPPPS